MNKSALMVWGGWSGHSARECTELFGPWLEEQGYEVEISDSTDVYLMHAVHELSEQGSHVTLSATCQRPEAIPPGLVLGSFDGQVIG